MYLRLANRINQYFDACHNVILLSKAQIRLHLVLGDNINHLCPVHLLTEWFCSLFLFIFSRLNPTGFVYGRLPISLWRCIPIFQMLTGNIFWLKCVSLELIFSFAFLFCDLVFKWWLLFIYENLEIILVLWKLRYFFLFIHISAIRHIFFIIYKCMPTTLLIAIYRDEGKSFLKQLLYNEYW